MPRVIISGYGLVSAIGGGAWATFSSLLAGRSVADRCDPLPENIEAVDLVRAVGSVSLAQHTATDVAIELAERAAREAMFMAGVGDGLDAIIGSSKGAMHVLSDVANRHVMRSGLRAPPAANGTAAVPLSYESSGRPASLSPGAPADLALAVALGPHGYLAHHLHQRLRLHNVAATVAACASSLTALHQARLRLLHEPDAPDHVLVLTSEAALLSVFVHSYDRLGVLPALTTSGYRGLPLDQKRSGFMLAEMGAAVVLKRMADGAPLPRGAVELTDTAIAADAFDVIRSSPQMPGLRRVAGQLFGGRTIDLLHPHATGTVDHDPAELAVYADLLQRPENVDVYAVKGAIGHGLGSAGLASLVIACVCAKARRRPPMPWLNAPIASPLPLSHTGKASAPITTQAVFSAGFGGHVAGALIETR